MKELLLTPRLFKSRMPTITNGMVFYRPGRAMIWALVLFVLWMSALTVCIMWDMLVFIGAGTWTLGERIAHSLKRTETA